VRWQCRQFLSTRKHHIVSYRNKTVELWSRRVNRIMTTTRTHNAATASVNSRSRRSCPRGVSQPVLSCPFALLFDMPNGYVLLMLLLTYLFSFVLFLNDPLETTQLSQMYGTNLHHMLICFLVCAKILYLKLLQTNV